MSDSINFGGRRGGSRNRRRGDSGNSGERGGRGEGGGGGGDGRRGGYRGPRRGRGFGKWTPPSYSSNAPEASGSQPVGRPAEEIVEYWSNAGAPPLPPEEPLKFEPPLTDFHLQAQAFMKEQSDLRNPLRDENGNPILDCRGSHGQDRLCQFCDGRNGSWVQPNPKPDLAFLRYQDSIIASGTHQFASTPRNRYENPRDNVLQLVPETEWASLDDEDYGEVEGKGNRSSFHNM